MVIFPDELISICMVNAMLTDVLARGGMTGYESTPVCAKPSYWMRRDDGEFIHEFTWKWTDYVEQICFGQVSSTDEI